MRIVNYKDVARNVSSMKMVTELSSQVGVKPSLLNEIFTLSGYENLTLMRLTQSLGEMFSKELKQGADIRNIDTMRIDWRMDAGPRIPETYISEEITDTFEGSADGLIVLRERMFSRGDVIELTDTGQQFRISSPPESLASDKHRYLATLLGTARDRRLANPTVAGAVGKRVRFIMGGVVPEASEYGSYFQMPNRMERHTNYMTRFRVDGSRSGDYAYAETIFLERLRLNKNSGQADGTQEYFKMDAEQKSMMDKLMYSINSGLLFSQGGFDDTLNHMVREIDGREIPIGQGIIPQMRAYGQFMGYNFISESILREIIGVIVERRPKKTGNDIVFLVNWKLFQTIQTMLDALVRGRLVPQDAYLKKDNDKKAYMVGTTYCGYEFAGNKIFIMEDSTLTDRYPDRGYGICFNTRVPTKNGEDKMNIQQFSIKGFEMFNNDLLGVGGSTGHSSGPVSSVVHASQSTLMAYRGVAVFDPYSTFIIEEN